MRFSKICIAVIILTMAFSSIFAQELGDKIYKELTVDGEKVSRLFKYDSFAEYDSKGNKIHHKASNWENWWKYDSKGNLLHRRTNYNEEEFYEYTYWDNGNLKKENVFTAS